MTRQDLINALALTHIDIEAGHPIGLDHDTYPMTDQQEELHSGQTLKMSYRLATTPAPADTEALGITAELALPNALMGWRQAGQPVHISALRRIARQTAIFPDPANIAELKLRAGDLVAVTAGHHRRLQQRWSPQQISARLALDFPDDAAMRISHEAIYQSLFVQSRRALRRDLSKCLRTRRVHRRPRGRRQGGPLKDMAPVSQRPAEADDRRTPGHWEGDLIIGKRGRSAIATLVERTTRFTVLVRLPAGRTSGSLHAALTTTLPNLPDGWARSLTWDQGKEMADHARITADTGVPIYFCRPSCPWQRGTNENTNGLLRQYLPKGTDLSPITQHELDQIAAELNGRPRRVLKWMTPSEEFNRTSATTA